MKDRLSPRPWSIVGTMGLMFWVLGDISGPVELSLSTIFFGPLIFLLLLVNYLWRLGRSFPPDTGHWGYESPAEGRWRWFILPGATAIIFSALAYPWPMTYRFLVSRGAFERKVAEVQQSGEDQGPQRVGLYWVKGIEAGPGGCVNFVTGASFIDPVGFAHDPTRPLSSWLNRRVVGNWYAREW